VFGTRRRANNETQYVVARTETIRYPHQNGRLAIGPVKAED
jgi:hypothetical protein